ncbi:hypothetical protein ACTQ45_09345 [Fundicoccus sp. Sow4_D5]|uniref:hypothetical protein n=1 Tax=unclassified Fundicoccus TaxID=2761543 RepID=UPI003F8DC106
MMNELLKQYFDAFHESFPVSDFKGSREELEEVLRRCIESGIAYHDDYLGPEEFE